MSDAFKPGDKVVINMFGSDSDAEVVCMLPSGDVLVRFEDPIAKHVLPSPYGQYETKHVRHRSGGAS